MNTAAPQLPPGTVIDGTYTTGAVVRSRLGSVTYAATDLSQGRVDVTIHAPECFVSPVALERSLREIRQLEKVHAPQVLRVIDAGKLPRGDRLAIVTNGHGPGTMAADCAADRGVPLARLTPETQSALTAVLPPNVDSTNPVNIRRDAQPELLARAVSTVLADHEVDAVLTLHVQRPATGATTYHSSEFGGPTSQRALPASCIIATTVVWPPSRRWAIPSTM